MPVRYEIRSAPDAEADYTPYGGVREFMLCRDSEFIIAGPAETGKSLGACWKFHLLALKYPGAQLAIIRKTRRSLVGSILQTWERQVLDGAPITKYGSNNPQWYDYPNGSRVWVGGMDDPRKMLSTEFDAILVNQPEELSLPEWEVLTTRATGRAGNMPYSFICGDGNPGPPTHWIKSRARSATNPNGPLTLIESTHRDNPVLYDQITGELTEQGRRTLSVLDNLTGARKMRLRYGLWAQPEGAIYEIFDEERHKAVSFPIPMTWPRVVGIDPLGAYVGALWGAFDPVDRKLHIYREYLQPFGVTTPEHARAILKLTGQETVWAWVVGAPSERQARLDWQAAGIPGIAPPAIGVWEGIDRVIQLLADGALVVHDCAVNLLSEIGSYRRKLTRGGEPTEVIEKKSEYHLLDCLRGIAVHLLGREEETRVLYAPAHIGPDW